MRLGKEQSAGYVEDTEVESIAAQEIKVEEIEAEEIKIDSIERSRVTPTPQPTLPVG
jgi:hypothetical protein